MILAVDVHYYQDKANAAGVLFSSWQSKQPDCVVMERCEKVAEYRAGQLYKRELLCILRLLKVIDMSFSCVIIDGYVSLGKEQQPELGMYLYNALDGKIPVIGVAKSQCADTPLDAELLRGNSQHPLYISAAGISLGQAKQHIQSMHGKCYIPQLLKEVDRVCRLAM